MTFCEKSEMYLLIGRAIQVLAIILAFVITVPRPSPWTIWLAIPIAAYFVGSHFVRYHKVALHIAARAGKIDKIIDLVGRGYDVNGQQDHGMTPLHWAVIKNQIEAIRQLIRLGASPDIPDNNGNTPAMIAQSLGQIDAIQAIHTATSDNARN